MISVNDLKTGLTLDIDNGLWSVVEFLHVKPGKGAAFVRTKLKNVETGQVVEKTFRAGEKVAKAMLDRREMQYLYKDKLCIALLFKLYRVYKLTRVLSSSDKPCFIKSFDFKCYCFR